MERDHSHFAKYVWLKEMLYSKIRFITMVGSEVKTDTWIYRYKLQLTFHITEELLKAVSPAHHGSSAAVTILKEDCISRSRILLSFTLILGLQLPQTR